MSDSAPVANGPAYLTIALGFISWIFNKVGVGDIAAFMSVTVGLYTIYINWPRFRERIKETFKKKK